MLSKDPEAHLSLGGPQTPALKLELPGLQLKKLKVAQMGQWGLNEEACQERPQGLNRNVKKVQQCSTSFPFQHILVPYPSIPIHHTTAPYPWGAQGVSTYGPPFKYPQ